MATGVYDEAPRLADSFYKHSWKNESLSGAQWIPVWYCDRVPPVQSCSFLAPKYSTVYCQLYYQSVVYKPSPSAVASDAVVWSTLPLDARAVGTHSLKWWITHESGFGGGGSWDFGQFGDGLFLVHHDCAPVHKAIYIWPSTRFTGCCHVMLSSNVTQVYGRCIRRERVNWSSCFSKVLMLFTLIAQNVPFCARPATDEFIRYAVLHSHIFMSEWKATHHRNRILFKVYDIIAPLFSDNLSWKTFIMLRSAASVNTDKLFSLMTKEKLSRRLSSSIWWSMQLPSVFLTAHRFHFLDTLYV